MFRHPLFHLFFFICFSFPPRTSAFDTQRKVLWLPIHGTIELGIAPYVKRAIQHAERNRYDGIVLEIDTLGGRIDAAIMIRDAVLESKVPTVAWIHKRAISAGALIALACHKIFFSPASTMGAATPIQLGEGSAKPVEEKFVSYFKAEMGATAERFKRDRKIAERMVRSDDDLKDYVKKGEVLTLTETTATELKFGDGTAETPAALFERLHWQDSHVENLPFNWAEKVVRWITEPTVSSTLMSVGVIGMMIEFQVPGFGLPGMASLLAFGLYFFGKFIVDLAGWEELILFVVGILLLATELLLLPGKLIPGILGVIFIFVALFLSGISPHIPFQMDLPEVQSHIHHLSVVFLITVVAFILAYIWISRNPLRSPMVLGTQLDSRSGYSSHQLATVAIGMSGETLTPLRPTGNAQFENGMVEVSAEMDFIDSGTKVVVSRIDGFRIVVKRA